MRMLFLFAPLIAFGVSVGVAQAQTQTQTQPSQSQMPQLQYRSGGVGVIGGGDQTLNRVQQARTDDSVIRDMEEHISAAVVAARPAYEAHGSPRIAVYMGDSFADLSARAEAAPRVTLREATMAAGVVVDEEAAGYVESLTVTELEITPQSEIGLVQPDQEFLAKFGVGVSRVLRQVPLRQLDHRVAQQRLIGIGDVETQTAPYAGALGVTDADAPAHTTAATLLQALHGHAEYLAEFRFIRDAESVTDFSVEVRLVRVFDGLVLGAEMFQPGVLAETEEYEMTEAGYQHVAYDIVPTALGIGQGAAAMLLTLFTESRSLL